MNAIIHGIVLAFGLILPLGVQNVFIFSKARGKSIFGGLSQLSSVLQSAIPC